MISSSRVQEIMQDCLYLDTEVIDGKPPQDAVIVEGVIHNFGFHPVRLETHRSEIRGMLDQLPNNFMHGSGGGWSFLNLCTDKDNNLWTGEHMICEMLFVLAAGLGLASFCLSREFWGTLPGSMPYVCFKL